MGSIEMSVPPVIHNGRWLQASFHRRPHCVFQIEPGPVMDLRAAFVGVTHVALTWKNDNMTDTCRMLLEGSQESTENLMVNISNLKPGSQYMVTVYPLGSNETESGLGESQKWASDPQGLGRDEVTLVSLPASFLLTGLPPGPAVLPVLPSLRRGLVQGENALSGALLSPA